jgi:hypothetical protein
MMKRVVVVVVCLFEEGLDLLQVALVGSLEEGDGQFVVAHLSLSLVLQPPFSVVSCVLCCSPVKRIWS